LRAALAEAQARLSQYEGVEGVQVRQAPISAPGFAMPSPTTMLQLLHVVSEHFQLPLVEERQFAAAFTGLAFMARTEVTDKVHYAAYWRETVKGVNRQRGQFQDFSADAFLLAVLAHGDIPCTDWRLVHLGVICEFGLNEFGIGRKATDGWKRTLAGQFVTPIVPIKLKKNSTYPTPQPIITVDGKVQPPVNEMNAHGPTY
jgi:hypothetical protein